MLVVIMLLPADALIVLQIESGYVFQNTTFSKFVRNLIIFTPESQTMVCVIIMEVANGVVGV